MKPHIHAENSAKQFGGKPADYIEIHKFLDSSKGVIADHRHRALTHNTWFISNVLERVFGYSIKNSDGQEVSVRDIGEQHVLEDFRGKFIPSAQDWLEEMDYAEWMNNGKETKPTRRRSAPKLPSIHEPQIRPNVPQFEDVVYDGSQVAIRPKPPWPPRSELID